MITSEVEQGTAIRYDLGPGLPPFQLPKLEQNELTKIPSAMFTGALIAVDEYIQKAREVNSNAKLSQVGREEELAPLKKQTVLSIANSVAQVDSEAMFWDKKEADLVRVPALDPTHGGVAVEDREMRDWWSRQPVAERTRMLERIGKEAGHERFMIALLRSPIPQLDQDVEYVRRVWKDLAAVRDPMEAMAIGQGRRLVDWANRGLSYLAAIAPRATGMEKKQLLEVVMSAERPEARSAYKLFGFTRADADRFQFAAEQRRLSGR